MIFNYALPPPLAINSVSKLGITSGFPDYGFPAHFCNLRYVLYKKFALKIDRAGFLKSHVLGTLMPIEKDAPI